MNDSLIGSAHRKGGPEYCSDCRQPLPPGAVFCPHCGPPNPPEDDPEEGIGFGQTLFRIFLMLLLFGAIAVFKLDLDLFSGPEAPIAGGPGMLSPEGTKTKKTHAVDFETIHHIKVARSKVREKPASDGKVLTVLSKGAKVTILEGNEAWWKIKQDKTRGWIIKEDLDTQIR